MREGKQYEHTISHSHTALSHAPGVRTRRRSVYWEVEAQYTMISPLRRVIAVSVIKPVIRNSIGRSRRTKTRGQPFICYNQQPFSHVTGSLWHSISARAHSCKNIVHTGRFREDGRIFEGRRQIVLEVSSQYNERLARRAQFSRDRLGCLAAEVDVEDGDIAPRLKLERFSDRPLMNPLIFK
jgi:hypothetical protein